MGERIPIWVRTYKLPVVGALLVFGSSIVLSQVFPGLFQRVLVKPNELQWEKPYLGTVDFYGVDPSDPIAATYQRIFPGLFKPFEAMPQELQTHIRYPEDLFFIQAHVFQAYHMDNPDVFYNREDLCQFPREQAAGGMATMAPYYIIMLKDTALAWYADRGPRLGAALAFYTLFPLAPLLIIVIAVAALAFGRERAQAQLAQQIEAVVGAEGARAIRAMLEHTSRPSSGVVATLVGLATLLFGATVVVYPQIFYTDVNGLICNI